MLRTLPQANDERGIEWAKTSYAETYATSVTVHAAVRLRANAVARARLKAHILVNDQLEWVGENHPVQRLIDKVNPFWSGRDQWRGVETYLSLFGSSIRWVNKVGSDVSRWEIWPLRADQVAVVREGRRYIKGFLFDPQGARFAMLPDEVLWDRYFNPLDEFAGLSPIAPAKLDIDMRLDMLKANRNLFQQGVLTQNLAFFLKGMTSLFDVQEFRERIKERYSGPQNANQPLVIQSDIADVKNLGFSNRDMEFLAGLGVTRQDILTALGVDEEILPGAERTTFANRDAAERNFYQNIITEEWALLEATMQEQFLPMLPEQYRNLVFKFDVEGIAALADNQDEVAERHRANVAAGLELVDEARQAMGMDELPNGMGQVLYVPVGVLPVRAGEDIMAPPAEPNEEPQGAIEEAFRHLALKDGTDEKTWRAFIERTDDETDAFIDLQRGLFNEQRDAVKKSLRNRRRQEGNDVFDEDDWNRVYGERARPLYEDVIRTNAEAQIAEFSLGVAFDVENPVTQAWIDERMRFWATHVNEETGRQLLNEIRVGVSEGESIRQLQARVDNVFDFASEFRSERIARTEVTSAANQGHLDAYRRANVPRKRWIATLDDRVRDAHAVAHGQTVGVDEAFLVGGEAIMAPGQGSAANAVNCRCSTSPVFEETRMLPVVVEPRTMKDMVIHEVHERDAHGLIVRESHTRVKEV
jgi:HK97 family phage portal protein